MAQCQTGKKVNRPHLNKKKLSVVAPVYHLREVKVGGSLPRPLRAKKNETLQVKNN
jgi:hypothetical protein